MQPKSLADAISSWGLSNVEFARLVRSSTRAVQGWLAAEREVPGPVEAFCSLFASLPPAMRAAEIAKLRNEDHNMFDGMYLVRFVGESNEEGAGMLVLQRGVVFGVDTGGVAFDGRYEPGATPGTLRLDVRVSVPANVGLVQGTPPMPFPYSFDVTTELNSRGRSSHAMVTPHGPLVVAFSRLRDLPAMAA